MSPKRGIDSDISDICDPIISFDKPYDNSIKFWPILCINANDVKRTDVCDYHSLLMLIIRLLFNSITKDITVL